MPGAGSSFELAASGLGEELDGDGHDLYYLGGGQDRDQRLCAVDLLRPSARPCTGRGPRGRRAGVCGGYQLLGHSYVLDGEEIPGVGLVDVTTHREPGPRLIGNSRSSSPDPVGVLAGFENHGGRTRLGPSERPLGRVLRGHGNDGRSGFEGVRRGNVIGTYLHGPLLPKNAWFADWLIAAALRLDPADLAPLESSLEDAAHASAARRRRPLNSSATAPGRRSLRRVELSEYQRRSRSTAHYPREAALAYPTLGLAGEAGEVADHIKKVIRDDGWQVSEERLEALTKELGDVLWYVAQLASELGLELEEIAAGEPREAALAPAARSPRGFRGRALAAPAQAPPAPGTSSGARRRPIRGADREAGEALDHAGGKQRPHANALGRVFALRSPASAWSWARLAPLA